MMFRDIAFHQQSVLRGIAKAKANAAKNAILIQSIIDEGLADDNMDWLRVALLKKLSFDVTIADDAILLKLFESLNQRQQAILLLRHKVGNGATQLVTGNKLSMQEGRVGTLERRGLHTLRCMIFQL